MSVLVEVCVDSVAGALAAEEGGAGRLELCSALLEGGLTPSAGLLELVVKRSRLPVMAMLRPRGGDFCYTQDEVDVMLRDLEVLRAAGVAGVVLGVLEPSGRIDLERTGELVRRARPLRVTFHRAFDLAIDPHEALEDLVSLGIERVLTSGQERTVPDGLSTLRALCARARGRIAILPGGGVNDGNVLEIVRALRVEEVHMSGRSTVESRMVHRNPRCSLGGTKLPEEYSWGVTDAARVRRVVDLLGTVPLRPA